MHKVQLYPVPLIIDLLCGLLAIGIASRRSNAITQGRQAVTADMSLLPGRFPATLQPSGWGCEAGATWKQPCTGWTKNLTG